MHRIASYQVAAESLIGITGVVLPYLLIVLGCCLCFDLMVVTVLRVSLLIALCFLAAQTMALARGLEIECGCFGSAASLVSFRSLVPPFLIAVACLVRLWFDQSIWIRTNAQSLSGTMRGQADRRIERVFAIERDGE